MRNIALGDVRVLVLMSMCHPRMGAGEQPHPTWTQEAHSRTVERWLGASARCNIPGGVRASGRHEGNRVPGHGGGMYHVLGRARDSGCYTDSGDGAGYAGPPMSRTTRHTYASKRAAPVRSGGNPRGAVPHARPPCASLSGRGNLPTDSKPDSIPSCGTE